MFSKKNNIVLNSSLKASINDGCWTAGMAGIGENYLSAFAVFLNGTPLQFGLLASFPAFIGALFQVWSLKVINKIRSRREFIASIALAQSLLWLPLAAFALYAPTSSTSVSFLLIVLMIFYAAGNAVVPAWNSLLGDMVEPDIRGKFFGLRNARIGLYTILSILSGGMILEVFSLNSNYTRYGFFILFVTAFVCRYNAYRWLKRYDDPEHIVHSHEQFTFYQFMRRTRESNFVKFVLFIALFNFSIWVSGPFYAVYMLRDLQISYSSFTIVSASTIVSQMLCTQHWGHLADRHGTKKIITICSAAISIIPLLWLFSPDFIYIILIQIYAGIFNAGFNLATANFIFDAVSAPKRARCFAYFSMLNNLFMLLGSFVGGWMVSYFPAFRPLSSGTSPVTSPILGLFLLSAVLRIIIVQLFRTKFYEVRDVEPASHRTIFFRFVNIRPIIGMSLNIFLPDSKNESNDKRLQ